MWEFQRRNEEGLLEGWVGVTVEPDPNYVEEVESVEETSTGEESPRQVKRFTELRERWKDAGNTLNVPAINGRRPRFSAPIAPESPSQSQVAKAQFGSRQKLDIAEDTQDQNPYQDIGGLDKEMSALREMVEYPLRFPEMFQKVGIDAPRGVLLCGPPGCGKTLLARKIAEATDAHFQVINGPELVGSFQGESEANLRKVFEKARKKSPSILFFDEIDAIAPKREEATGPEKRLVTQLLTLMDGLEGRGQVIVIASTNTPNDIDNALRRPGRFDRELWFSSPDKDGRRQILAVHTCNLALDDSVDLDDLAERTHGFVGADIAALCREAGLHAIRAAMPQIEAASSSASIPTNLSNLKHAGVFANIDPAASCVTSAIPEDLLSDLCIKRSHFEAALEEVKPASLRNQQVTMPKVQWKEIGGLKSVKDELEEAVIWPLRHAKLFEEADVQPPKGILLSGPPGTGKTMLAKALANESGVNFISVKGPSLVSKFVGETEKQIRDVFAQARQAAPCILFFDEIDAITPARGQDAGNGFADRLVGQILVEMDGIEKLENVLILGATNRPDAIDPALRRPGRFDRVIQIPLPDEESRLEILKVHTARKPIKDIDLERIAAETEGFSGAELQSLCRNAALAAVRRAVANPEPVDLDDDGGEPGTTTIRSATIYESDFDNALGDIRKQVQKRLIEETAAHAVAELRADESGADIPTAIHLFPTGKEEEEKSVINNE
jgi:transitional endoplasmic reticulum ATPase